MKMSKREIFGISEAFNHALEWRSRGADCMIQRNVCPALRATDYKCPKYIWLIEEDEQDSGRVNEHELNEFMGGHTKKKPKEIYLKQYPHGFNDGFEYHDVCPAITISSWQHNNFIIENYDTALGRRVDEVRAIGRERTEEEKLRRHLHGDKGAKFSSGKRMCILGSVSSCITTLPCKDNLIAEFYE